MKAWTKLIPGTSETVSTAEENLSVTFFKGYSTKENALETLPHGVHIVGGNQSHSRMVHMGLLPLYSEACEAGSRQIYFLLSLIPFEHRIFRPAQSLIWSPSPRSSP
jgi:hypothetical protein